MRIAVIGSGISGLSAAHYLSKKNKVDLFEKEDHFGGHSYTIDVKDNNNHVPVDIGFIVFNFKTYPNFVKFLNDNGIEIEKSNMSFSVSVKETEIEYCGKGLLGIFSNKKNLLNFDFFKMFFEIIKFYKKSNNLKNIEENLTLDDFLKREKMSKYFINYHIIPMVSAIWSMPPYEAKQMPLKFFLKFFQNHGLFNLKNRPQWYTIKNRSRTYVKKILETISGEYYKNYRINKISRLSNGVKVYYGGNNEFFDYDKVVIATHADEALSLITDPTPEEKSILANFKYKNNIAIIHTDESLMPKNKKAWSSWNSSVNKENTSETSITYWLNLLQNLKTNKNIFLSLNPFLKIDPKKIISKVKFTHPYYDKEALENQNRLKNIQNKKNLLFCGSYFGYGFHEDGIKSSLEMIKSFNDR
jgi:predicted NAD/FAD-binding protein|tara:strand:+ start:390 stop:1631 length:1242 start_codon:yes stop_codon:yes gene_type:complete